MTPENKSKNKIRGTLQRIAVETATKMSITSLAAGGYGGGTGISDMVVMFTDTHGTAHTIWIEAKAKNNKPTAKQDYFLRHTVAGCGSYGWVVWGDDAADLQWMHDAVKSLLLDSDITGVARLKLEKCYASSSCRE